MFVRCALTRLGEGRRFHRSEIEGSVLGQETTHLLRQLALEFTCDIPRIGKRFRPGYVGHIKLMLDPGFRQLKRCGHVENRPAVLNRHDPAYRKTSPVALRIHLIDNRCFHVAAPQKIRMQRVW